MNLIAGEEKFWGGRGAPAEVSPSAPIWTYEFMKAALAGSCVGTWQVEMETALITWDAETSRIFGLEPVAVNTGALLPVHADDQVGLWRTLKRCHRTGEPYDSVFRGLRADGETRWLHGKGRAYPANSSAPRYMAGTVWDITDRRVAAEALVDREARLNTIFKQALVGIMEVGRGGEVRMVNSRFGEILGRDEEELRGSSVADYTHPDDLKWNMPLLRKQADVAEPFRIEKRYIRPNGEIVWCDVSVSFVVSPAGIVESSIVVAEDITARKAATTALRESEMLYESVLEASADCIKIIGLGGNVEFINTPGTRVMELDCTDQVLGHDWIQLWPEQSQAMIAAALDSARAGDNVRCTGFRPTAKGTPKWWDISVTPMRGEDGKVERILAISRDITDQRGTADQLRWASEHDALTELPNRRSFEARLQAATLRATNANSRAGLLLLDLDHFKHVNDTLGHDAGDHLLKAFGKRVQESVRSTDFVARLGGDEFAVILEGGQEPDLASAGESILTRLREPIFLGKRVISVGASIGGASFPQDASSAHELFKNADIALYALKSAGRGGTRLFHQNMRQEAQLISSQLSLARSAITRKSVEPHYQQKVDLKTGRIEGFEALLRWRHPTRGIQQPDSVAEAFKDYELASKIGELMQRRVFSDVRGWLDSGVPTGFVAINAAPVEFLRDDFAEQLLARMREHDIPSHLIEIEVTEHVFLESGSAYVGRALNLLASQGVRIALDDFGTGYSSLSHLRDYPVHVVKIDKSFVDKITSDAEVRAIVCAVIDLAKSLGIEVVAEGVEDQDQHDLLIQHGCILGQGFLFGRAIEADEVPLLLGGSDAVAAAAGSNGRQRVPGAEHTTGGKAYAGASPLRKLPALLKANGERSRHPSTRTPGQFGPG